MNKIIKDALDDVFTHIGDHPIESHSNAKEIIETCNYNEIQLLLLALILKELREK